MAFEPSCPILDHITVLDLTRVRSGPTCVRQLADWGANVLKIETVLTFRICSAINDLWCLI